MAVQVGWAGVGFAPLHSEHIVQLYRKDRELLDNICAYAMEAFRYNHAVLFLATRAHCETFKAALRRRRVDVDQAIRDGQLNFVVAEEVMPRFLRGENVDDDLFRTAVADALDQARGGGRYHHVQVFGELVDVLWQAGNARATLRVEELWNELRQKIPVFTLYCGFHVSQSPDELLRSSMRDVLVNHSHLLDASTASTEIPAPRGVLVQLADLTRDDAMQIGSKVRELSHGGSPEGPAPPAS